MRHMKPQTSTMLPVIPCSRLTFLRCADPRKLQQPIPKDIRAGGFSSRTESNKQLCPGTHRPAIHGINPRSRAHFPRKPRIYTRGTQNGPTGRIRGSTPAFFVARQHPVGPQKRIVHGNQPHLHLLHDRSREKGWTEGIPPHGHNKQQLRTPTLPTGKSEVVGPIRGVT